MVKHISDNIAVMYLGCMVEKAASRALFQHQYHPYTKALLSAIPVPKVTGRRERVILKGEIVSPINVTEMCRFAPRCPYAGEECRRRTPKLEEVAPGHFVACHLTREINQISQREEART